MAIRCYIPNTGALCSKPLGGSKVDLAFRPPEVEKISTRNFWEICGNFVILTLYTDLAVHMDSIYKLKIVIEKGGHKNAFCGD